MSLAVVQAVGAGNPVTGGNAALTTNSVTLTATTGNLLVIEHVLYSGGAIPTLTPSTSLSGSFTLQSAITNNADNRAGGFALTAWTKLAAGGSETITITESSAFVSALVVREISGAAAASFFDVTGTGTDVSTNTSPYTATSNAGTATQTGELLLLTAINNAEGGSATQPTGFTQDSIVTIWDTAFNEVTIATMHQTALTSSTTIPATSYAWTYGTSPGFIDVGITLYTIVPAAAVAAPSPYPPWRRQMSHIAQ